MRTFDQLEWVHQFGDYEMLMYLHLEHSDDDGIRMQMLKRDLSEGAEQWDILYDRLLSSVIGDVSVEANDPAFEDEVLRRYLHEHPNLVEEEKAYLKQFSE